MCYTTHDWDGRCFRLEVGADLFGIYEEEAEAKKAEPVAANRLVRTASMISPEAVPK